MLHHKVDFIRLHNFAA